MKKILGILFCLLLIPCMAAGVDESTYKLGPGDALLISVWKDENLTKELIVPPDGVISFPLIEDINVEQMTVSALREVLRNKLSEYVPDATVTVMLLNPLSMKGYVIGRVNNPGQFEIGRDTTVMQILAMAGGMQEFASTKKILILRQEGEKTTKIPFNYKEMENGENLDQNIFLRKGDVVVVP